MSAAPPAPPGAVTVVARPGIAAAELPPGNVGLELLANAYRDRPRAWRAERGVRLATGC